MILSLLIWLVALPEDALAGFDEGMAAYEAEEYETAIAEWSPLADNGDVRAHYWLGIVFRFGEGAPRDYAKALVHLRKAASQTTDGDIYRRAIYSLGYMAEEGHGVKADMVKAECLYRVSAENGYANAQYALSLLIRLKPGISPKTLDWVERAAKQGDALSLFGLGELALMNPLRDYSYAYRLLTLAADRGDSDAMHLIEEASKSTNEKVRKSLLIGRQLAREWEPVVEKIPEPPIPIPEPCVF
jgi:uncharacterized protein